MSNQKEEESIAAGAGSIWGALTSLNLSAVFLGLAFPPIGVLAGPVAFATLGTLEGGNFLKASYEGEASPADIPKAVGPLAAFLGCSTLAMGTSQFSLGILGATTLGIAAPAFFTVAFTCVAISSFKELYDTYRPSEQASSLPRAPSPSGDTLVATTTLLQDNGLQNDERPRAHSCPISFFTPKLNADVDLAIPASSPLVKQPGLERNSLETDVSEGNSSQPQNEFSKQWEKAMKDDRGSSLDFAAK